MINPTVIPTLVECEYENYCPQNFGRPQSA